MKYLIPVFVGGAAITVAVTTALAQAHGALNGRVPLAPYLYGYGAALVLLVIAGIMALKAAKEEKTTPSPAPVQHNEQRVIQEANPKQEQHVHIGSDLFQTKPARLVVHTAKSEQQPNIQFVEIKNVDGSFTETIVHGLPLTERKTTAALLVCFRNEAIPGQTPRQPQVDAHVIYKSGDGKELTDLSHGVWAEESANYTTFQTGHKKCLVVTALSEGMLCKMWKEEYHTRTSWTPGGTLFENRIEQVQGKIATIVVQLLDHWKGTCISEFILDVEAVADKELPSLKLKQ
jgi:hypothetical protein